MPAAQPHGRRAATGCASPREPRPGIAREPFIDFSSGYVLRSIDKFPKQGATAPWRLYQNYALDILTLRFGPLDDGTLQFGGRRGRHGAREQSPLSAPGLS